MLPQEKPVTLTRHSYRCPGERDHHRGFNMYLYQQARKAHYRDLRREAAEHRMLSHLPRHRLNRRVAGKLGVLLLKLGAWLKHFEQAQAALEKHAWAPSQFPDDSGECGWPPTN